ncbi:4601_t:CDS:2, partial [Acaulospora colombiana]
RYVGFGSQKVFTSSVVRWEFRQGSGWSKWEHRLRTREAYEAHEPTSPFTGSATSTGETNDVIMIKRFFSPDTPSPKKNKSRQRFALSAIMKGGGPDPERRSRGWAKMGSHHALETRKHGSKALREAATERLLSFVVTTVYLWTSNGDLHTLVGMVHSHTIERTFGAQSNK